MALSWSCWLSGQITIPSNLLPRPGDSLYVAVDQLPTTLRPITMGKNQRWDLTTMQAPFTRRIVWRPAQQGRYGSQFRSAEMVAPIDELTEGYFRTSGGELQLVGMVGPDPLGLSRRAVMRFQPPLLERKLPLRYGEAFQADAQMVYTLAAEELPASFRKKLPINPDSVRIRVGYDRQFHVDGWGKLVAPGGYYDVVREKRTEIRDYRLEAKIGQRRWQDLTSAIADKQLLRPTTAIAYHFLNNNEKEPIAIVWMDPAEKKPLRVEYKASDPEASIQNLTNLKPDVYAFPNPAIINVRFEFYNLPPGAYLLTIYNILGVEQWSRRYILQGNLTEKVDISELKRGTYLYSLKDENGKTLTTKRLMVLRP